jgi:hypothetical protein
MAITENQRKIVLAELEQGHSLRKACEMADIPNNASVLHLVESDPDGFGLHYAHARQNGYRVIADRIRDTAADMSIPADHKRIMVDTDKWMLSKMLPKIYGDRLDLNHSGKVSTEQTLTRAELMAIAAQGKAVGGVVKDQGEGGE